MQTDPIDDRTLLDGTGSLVTYLVVSGTVEAYNFKGDASQLTNLNLSGSNTFTSSQQVLDALRDKTLEVNTLVAQQYVVSSSVYYVTQSWSSGSTIFGNSTDDTHQFTGSVSIQGPLTITGGVTGSITTASYIDPLFISASAVQYGFSTPPLYWDNIQNKPTNIISGSGQRDILGLGISDNVVFGTVSASSANFDGNVVIDGTLTAKTYVISSSILDITTLRESGSTIFGNTPDDTHEFTGSLLISGSVTSNIGYYGNLTGTSSYSSLSETSSYLDPLFISASVAYYGFAGATGVQWDNILFKPTNIISGSGQRDILGLAETDSPRFSTIYGTNANLDGNLVVGGTITARTYVISSSVVNYETLKVSGSTKFGDSTDDKHEFTGSISTDSPLIFSNETTYGPPNLSGTTDRLTLWDNSTNPSAYNYAIGIEGNHLWSSVDVNHPDWGFKWYAGGVEIAHLDGTGNLGLTSISASSFTGSLEGTASYSLTASYALNAAGFESGSFATTGSNTFTGDQNFANNTVIGDTVYSTLGGNPINLYYGITKQDIANRFGGVKISNYDWGGGNLASKFEIFTDSEAQDFSTRRLLIDGFGNASITANTEITGNLVVSGKLTAQEFHTELISSSIIYESGSTKFGDTIDDNHQFTGSVNISGSLYVNTNTVITSNQTSSMSVLSSSYAATSSITYVSSSNFSLSQIEVADYDSNVAVTFVDGKLKFIFGSPTIPSSISLSLSGFATDRFNLENDAYSVNGSWNNGGYTIVSASLYTGSVLITEVYSGTSLSSNLTTSGSQSYRLQYTASSPLDGTLYSGSATATGTLSKINPTSPSQTETATVQLGATSNQIEQGASGSIAITSTTSSANNWTITSFVATGSFSSTTVPLFGNINGGQGNGTFLVTGSATGSNSITITTTANYNSGVLNDPVRTASVTDTITYSKIRSLRYGASTATSFSAIELENLALWDTSLGGSVGTISKGTTNPSGQTITITWTGDKYHYIIFDSSRSNLTNITTAGFGVLSSFTLTTVGSYKVYRTNTLQAGGAGTSITYVLT